ncbi:MAG TPA: bifunctional adenosylcobinamide kinase/adenosylcobinamide-phosphate guanylyltransferase [Trebonia sp.]|nr:bifunctional adenosylcobinamide kinase/adenosylcobinamide-phosphate guanylyltransferase [Trebonia sp.]
MDELTYQISAQSAPGWPAARVSSGRRVLVLGGSRSGKSRFAEQYLGVGVPVTYVATAPDYPGDADWAQRVRQHRERRPANWSTIETGDPARILDGAREGAPVLVDSITTWLSRVMDDCGCWAEELPAESAERLGAALDALIGAWAYTDALTVAVSDEVGSGIVPESVVVRRFRDALGDLNQRLAAQADEVWLVTAGIPLRLR